MTMLTIKRLKELLHYDPVTGVFTRLVPRPGPNGHVGAEAGCDNGQGYIRIYVDSVPYKARRLAWFYMTGEWVDEVDHRNTVRSDNRWGNLREATRGQNRTNCSAYKNNTSGLKGVSFYRPNGKWKAQIQASGRKTFLGYHDTPEEAHSAYIAMANKLHGEFARAV
jgi:hypothetical protein